MNVKDMFLKLFDVTIFFGTNLALVDSSKFDPDVLRAFLSTFLPMPFGKPFRTEFSLAGRALFIEFSVPLWIILSLLS